MTILAGGCFGDEKISFRRDIAPFLLSNCLACHNEQTREGGYSVASFDALLKPGDSEQTPINKSDAKTSELLRRLKTADSDERMPAESDPLPGATIQLVKRWIDQGAAYDAKDATASLVSVLPVTKHPTAPATYRFPVPITAISYVEDDLIVGGYHELIRWNLGGQSISQRIPQVGERIYAIEHLPELGRILVASGSPGKLGEVRIVEAKSGSLIGVPLVTTEVVHGIAVHPQENLVAIAGGDHKIYVLNLRSGQIVKTIGSHSDWVRSVVWSDDGQRLASASRDKTVKIFDLSSDKPLANYGGHGEDVVDVCFVPNETEQLVSCDAKGRVHRWTTKEGDKASKFSVNAMQTFCLQPTADGIWVSSTNALTKFTWDGEKQLHQLGLVEANALSIARSGEQIAIGDARGGVQIWNAMTGEKIATFSPLPVDE